MGGDLLAWQIVEKNYSAHVGAELSTKDRLGLRIALRCHRGQHPSLMGLGQGRNVSKHDVYSFNPSEGRIKLHHRQLATVQSYGCGSAIERACRGQLQPF